MTQQGDTGMRARVTLYQGKERAVVRGHPWLFSGAVEKTEGGDDAALAEVFAADGRLLGTGFLSPKSRIPVRMLAAGSLAIDRAFFAARVADAVELRDRLVPKETTGYRVINAEGDRIPGWTVDRFGEVLVSQITSAGLEKLRGEAYAALREVFPQCHILQRNAGAARRGEGLATRDETIHGEVPAEAELVEGGLRFLAEIMGGQKTGFYCDQRENRLLARQLAAGRSVLDLFAHSGAFGLNAAAGGALDVLHVESASRLIERGRRHAELNAGLADPARSRWLAADVFEMLREPGESFGMVICDPPPMARRRSHLERAARAYKDLNRLALGRLEKGGMLLTFSCSGAMDRRLFRQILFSAAEEAGVELSLLRPLAASADHPVAVTHPEGEYLRGWLAVRRA